MDQGFGFLILLLVHLVGMNAVSGLERIGAAVAFSQRNGSTAELR